MVAILKFTTVRKSKKFKTFLFLVINVLFSNGNYFRILLI